MLKLTNDNPWYSTAPIISNIYYFFKTPSISTEELLAQCRASQVESDALMKRVDATLARTNATLARTDTTKDSVEESVAATEKSIAASKAALKRHAEWRIRFAEMEAQLRDDAPETEANSTLPTSTPAPGV